MLMQAAIDQTDRISSQVAGIPVRNIWLLMLYASDLFHQVNRQQAVAVEDNPDDIADLVAEILAHAVERRLRRNLTHGYEEEHAVLNRVRGRIDLMETEAHRLLYRGVVACNFHHLTVDTPRNQYVRAALYVVSALAGRPELARRCRSLSISLGRLGVSDRRPSRTEISSIRFGRHDRDDRFMLAAAKLAFDLALPTELTGSAAIRAADRSVPWLRKLYEKAVGGFYDVVLSPQGWRVETGRNLHWPIEQATAGINAILPSMQLDIALENRELGRRIVIDTKFNALLTRGWYRDATLRSGYLYQIYAYLRSQAGRGDDLADHAEGVLLHPAVGQMIDESVRMQGHTLRFATVDLAAEAQEIRQQLLGITDRR